MVVIGTRPEAIKLVPIVLRARAAPDTFRTTVVTTSQHREMLDQMLEVFQIGVDVDLDLMRADQSLSELMSAAVSRLDDVIRKVAPDIVVVQGDTTTTLAGAMCAFHRQVPVAHVEAGLRTYDKRQPFPEEINRRLTTQIADYHFAPTEKTRSNLLHEGVPDRQIWVTGNTCIDTLFLTRERLGSTPVRDSDHKNILVTAHRRENHGEPLRRICSAILSLARQREDLRFTYPVHMSPHVRGPVFEMLSNHPRISLVEPLGYEEFVVAMDRAHLILTDSGGIQEEAPALGKPVLVLRETTERPEGVEAGTLRLVGTDESTIIAETTRLLEQPDAYREMAEARNPYGDGRAAERILEVLAGSREKLRS